jgi:hypothetical protein
MGLRYAVRVGWQLHRLHERATNLFFHRPSGCHIIDSLAFTQSRNFISLLSRKKPCK